MTEAHITRELLEKRQDRARRSKMIPLGEDIIRDMLELPDDVFVERLYFDQWRQSLIIVVSKESWDKVPGGTEVPVLYDIETVIVTHREQEVTTNPQFRKIHPHRHIKINLED
jgi:hypothetical protein